MTSLAGESRADSQAAYSFVSLADTKAGGSPLEAAAGGKLHKIVNKSLKYSHPREGECDDLRNSEEKVLTLPSLLSRDCQLDIGPSDHDPPFQFHRTYGQPFDGNSKSRTHSPGPHAVFSLGWKQDSGCQR